ncbi:hypothetical protein HY411_01265, partial [Candidatus Gottesmanbacteria bacterium]|nr:hypothetical protein [Candidatus Gottesmanbacteria bacterium]
LGKDFIAAFAIPVQNLHNFYYLTGDAVRARAALLTKLQGSIDKLAIIETLKTQGQLDVDAEEFGVEEERTYWRYVLGDSSERGRKVLLDGSVRGTLRSRIIETQGTIDIRQLFAEYVVVHTTQAEIAATWSVFEPVMTEELWSALPEETARFWRFYAGHPDPSVRTILNEFGMKLLEEGQRDIDAFEAIMAGAAPSDRQADASLGKRIIELVLKSGFNKIQLIHALVFQQVRLINETPPDASFVVTVQNWRQMLHGIIVAQDPDDAQSYQLTEAAVTRLKAAYEKAEAKDVSLGGLQSEWDAYLAQDDPYAMPLSLLQTPLLLDLVGNAGFLTHVESLGLFMNSFVDVLASVTTDEQVKRDIFVGMRQMEERFTRERWSREARSDYYNISRSVIQADPDLFGNFLSLFRVLTPAQMRQFARELYPLYRTQLTLMADAASLRERVGQFTSVVSTDPEVFARERAELLTDIKQRFKDGFGIIKTPDSFTPEHIRSILNISLYLANLRGRTPEKEATLGFYLALMINDQWDSYRGGGTVVAQDYLVPEKARIVGTMLEKRQQNSPITAVRLGIAEGKLEAFIRLLQKRSSSVVVGDVETIDVKLANIVVNLRRLEDLDLYERALDKDRMRVLLTYGAKAVGRVTAKLYQSLATPAKGIAFTPEDGPVRQAIAQVLEENNMDLTAPTVKEVFQDGIKPFATVVNVLQYVEDTRAEEAISELRKRLEPSDKIVAIFNRLGEDFTPSSGALAISQDLNYLDSIIVKSESELSIDERALLTEYVQHIREQLIALQGIYDRVRERFVAIQQSYAHTDNLQVQDALKEIEKIINVRTTQQAVTTTVTTNLNEVVENIRACLACTREGGNNDTNLTFGDTNKFFVFSQSETQQKGSIADEIVFFVPVSLPGEKEGMAFVFDRIYGTNTPTILLNHIDAVMKKYRALREQFPTAKVSIVVTQAAMSTAGLDSQQLEKRLTQRYGNGIVLGEPAYIEVDVNESATGDHYIEFGGDGRRAGKRQVTGITLDLPETVQAQKARPNVLEQIEAGIKELDDCQPQASLFVSPVYAAGEGGGGGCQSEILRLLARAPAQFVREIIAFWKTHGRLPTRAEFPEAFPARGDAPEGGKVAPSSAAAVGQAERIPVQPPEHQPAGPKRTETLPECVTGDTLL